MVQLLILGQNQAYTLDQIDDETNVFFNPSINSIIKRSQISYMADGGFTEVESFGVIISCVDGKISVLKTLLDPNNFSTAARLRQTGTMPKKTYLKLWNNIKKQGVFEIQNAAEPHRDIRDEFTYHFNLSVGNYNHEFTVYGITRHEVSRHFAVRSLIDSASKMSTLWTTHQQRASK